MSDPPRTAIGKHSKINNTGLGFELEVQKVLKRGPHTINKGFGQQPQFFAKERIIPSQNLVYEDVAFSIEPADPPGNAYPQRESILRGKFCGQRKDDGACESGLAEFRWLDGETGALFSGLCTHPRLKVDNI